MYVYNKYIKESVKTIVVVGTYVKADNGCGNVIHIYTWDHKTGNMQICIALDFTNCASK